jgi:hypothetical protein
VIEHPAEATVAGMPESRSHRYDIRRQLSACIGIEDQLRVGDQFSPFD